MLLTIELNIKTTTHKVPFDKILIKGPTSLLFNVNGVTKRMPTVLIQSINNDDRYMIVYDAVPGTELMQG